MELQEAAKHLLSTQIEQAIAIARNVYATPTERGAATELLWVGLNGTLDVPGSGFSSYNDGVTTELGHQRCQDIGKEVCEQKNFTLAEATGLRARFSNR